MAKRLWTPDFLTVNVFFFLLLLLHKSTPLNMFGANWSADCHLGHTTYHDCLIDRLLILWLNGQILTATLPNLPKKSFKSSEG